MSPYDALDTEDPPPSVGTRPQLAAVCRGTAATVAELHADRDLGVRSRVVRLPRSRHQDVWTEDDEADSEQRQSRMPGT